MGDAAYAHAEVFNTLEREDGPTLAPGRYALFSRTQHHHTLRPPGVGEHTAEVLTEVGYNSQTIQELDAEGAIKLGAPMVLRKMGAYR